MRLIVQVAPKSKLFLRGHYAVSASRGSMPMTVRDAVEATLMGRDIRLVQRCDVDRIVVALEGYGCYYVPMLIDALESSFGELQMQVGTAAAPAFLALLKAHLRKPADSEPPSTPQGAPPSTP